MLQKMHCCGFSVRCYSFLEIHHCCIADLPCFAENLPYFDKDVDLAVEHITNIIASKELGGYTTDTLPTACMHTAQLSRDFLAGGQII